jgi:hypothetical protein
MLGTLEVAEPNERLSEATKVMNMNRERYNIPYAPRPESNSTYWQNRAALCDALSKGCQYRTIPSLTSRNY